MNIVIGKFGKSILFNSKNWGPIGGDAAPSLTFLTYAKAHPEHTFYMIGKSDITRFRKKIDGDIFSQVSIPENIIDVWDGQDKSVPQYTWPTEYLKNIKVDAGMFFMGPTGRSNIPNFVYTVRNPDKLATSLQMFTNYVAPISYYLNESSVPYFILSEDPRYVPPAMIDTYNVEKFALSQFNKIIETVRVKSKEDPNTKVTHKVPYEYSKIETLFLLNEKKPDLLSMKKDIPFMMLLHGNDERFTIIKKWFIDTKIDVKVYGKWDSWEEQYPSIFKNIPMVDMMDSVHRTKYTLILGRKYPNFVTQKYWEMINLGIIPFIHNEYDLDKLLPIPEILRVKSPQEMLNKMTIIDNDSDIRTKLLRDLNDSLNIDFYNGNYINSLLDKSIIRLLNEPTKV